MSSTTTITTSTTKTTTKAKTTTTTKPSTKISTGSSNMLTTKAITTNTGTIGSSSSSFQTSNSGIQTKSSSATQTPSSWCKCCQNAAYCNQFESTAYDANKCRNFCVPRGHCVNRSPVDYCQPSQYTAAPTPPTPKPTPNPTPLRTPRPTPKTPSPTPKTPQPTPPPGAECSEYNFCEQCTDPTKTTPQTCHWCAFSRNEGECLPLNQDCSYYEDDFRRVTQCPTQPPTPMVKSTTSSTLTSTQQMSLSLDKLSHSVTSANSTMRDGESSSISVGVVAAIVGGVVGLCALILCAIGLTVYLRTKRDKEAEAEAPTVTEMNSAYSTGVAPPSNYA
eukprot:CAMPEP_0168602918 /NCGR_PEP_ID=MMETSP0420-20121227/14410_1 /TAXON_ID=498008 /ORGANISM="Pessonella sp." /LENGTH=333 /DNA_ID=CAMNT_0008641781 /DNA_START=12 /DNA_END=1009 /DNA_ORIENTATION=+